MTTPRASSRHKPKRTRLSLPMQHRISLSRGKGTMFQFIANCGHVNDFYSTFDVSDKSQYTDQKVFGNLRGHLDTTVELHRLFEDGIKSEFIGSVKFSYDVAGTKVSVLVFNTGSCKLCGGFPMHVKESFDVVDYNKYLDDCKRKFEQITKLKLEGGRLICVNGQFRLGNKLSNLLELDGFVRVHRSKFDHVKEPNLDNKGRRGAYKLYLHKDRKTHIALDYKGTCQVFACKTVEELFRTFGMLA